MMDEILTSTSMGISEFKQNPNAAVKDAHDLPFAVLTNNRPSFYVMSPRMFDYLTEKLWDAQMTPTILAEIKAHESGEIKGIPVTIEELRRDSRLVRPRVSAKRKKSVAQTRSRRSK
jgi:antitoxin StbD